MITGRWPHQTGVLNNNYGGINYRPNRDVSKGWTLARALQQGGYYTGFIGKTHISQKIRGDNDNPEFIAEIKDYGFDSVLSTIGKVAAGSGKRDCPYTRYLKKKGLYEKFSKDMIARRLVEPVKNRKPYWYCEPSPLSEEDYHDAWISRQGAEWLGGYNEDKPFFLWLNWVGPHPPFAAPGKYARMYDPANMALPYQDHRRGYPKGIYSENYTDYGSEKTRKFIANYFGMITLVDDGVGEVISVLKKRGMLDNTIVIYHSDHGEMLGNHGFYKKIVMYEDSVRVPLIVSFPKGFVQNKAIKTPVNLMDLVPTILELAEADFDRNYVQGTSLRSILAGKTTKHTGATFSEIASKAEDVKMVQTERYKYVYAEEWQKADNVAKALLFDLEKDPKELNNLSGDVNYIEIEKRLRDMIQEWQDNS